MVLTFFMTPSARKYPAGTLEAPGQLQAAAVSIDVLNNQRIICQGITMQLQTTGRLG